MTATAHMKKAFIHLFGKQIISVFVCCWQCVTVHDRTDHEGINFLHFLNPLLLLAGCVAIVWLRWQRPAKRCVYIVEESSSRCDSTMRHLFSDVFLYLIGYWKTKKIGSHASQERRERKYIDQPIFFVQNGIYDIDFPFIVCHSNWMKWPNSEHDTEYIDYTNTCSIISLAYVNSVILPIFEWSFTSSNHWTNKWHKHNKKQFHSCENVDEKKSTFLMPQLIDYYLFIDCINHACRVCVHIDCATYSTSTLACDSDDATK